MANIQIACVYSGSDKAKQGYASLNDRYSFVPPEECDIIVALGGDGFLLHSIHDYLHLRKPIYGMNCGTVGFLMNDFHLGVLTSRLTGAKQIQLYPLYMEAEMVDGSTATGYAFNEVSVTRHSGQSANIKISINGEERLSRFMGDGLIVSTAAGSTAYNLSAHGPIIPLESNLLALTPVSPFRPRRWKGALLPNDARVTLENLDPGKRPLAVSADFKEMYGIRSVSIRQENDKTAMLLFDPDRSLEERIITEQFTV